MIELFDFQNRAVAQIAERFTEYLADRPLRGRASNRRFVPFYQALASITASGKTVIMADAVSQIMPVLPLKPIVLWLSKGRVVVSQTLVNLQDGGKYRHLLSDFQQVRPLSEFARDEVDDQDLALVYLATVGTFNQRSKEQGDLRLFRSDLDTADRSIWDALKERSTQDGTRRPLLVVYDEAHNLTDQQTELLMELEPDAFLLASATPKLPQAILKVIADLREDMDWGDDKFTTYVSSKDVVDAGLVKRQVLLGGYQAQMEATVDDLLRDMELADQDIEGLGLSLRPKAIYVCRTNIVEGNALQQDDPKRPFSQREAPPIVIWRYLVQEKGIDPSTVAVYTSALKFDKAHPAPSEFVHFKGGDSDYGDFISGAYRHIIFNLGLQEGWDDPECYFAYIDKSMQSTIQVEQVIGRVLRQPEATHFESERLNTANFYVRVDQRGVFSEIVKEVGEKLAAELPEVQISSYDPAKRNKPVAYAPKSKRLVPHIWRDPAATQGPIDTVIEKLIDFRKDSGENIKGKGAKALVQQRVGEDQNNEVQWVQREHNNLVSARWIFQTAVRRQFPLALEVTRSDDPKFDARIELGSNADTAIREAADDVVRLYLEHVKLKQGFHNPYRVGEIMVDPTKVERFKNSVHEGYSGLNQLELAFAKELDKTRMVWCRNPSRSGFPIPLLSTGQSKAFYPDFLAWKGNTIFALDTTGEHILTDKLARKLLAVGPHPKGKTRLLVRLISQGNWDDRPQRVSGEGFTVWSLGYANALLPKHCSTMAEAVKIAVKSE